jgi:plasmid maintenance system antidote protein VapI
MSSPAEDGLRHQLRDALAHVGISQADAARQLGLSAKHMSHMLTGRAPLTLAWADRIAALCGMRVAAALEHVREEP